MEPGVNADVRLGAFPGVGVALRRDLSRLFLDVMVRSPKNSDDEGSWAMNMTAFRLLRRSIRFMTTDIWASAPPRAIGRFLNAEPLAWRSPLTLSEIRKKVRASLLPSSTLLVGCALTVGLASHAAADEAYFHFKENGANSEIMAIGSVTFSGNTKSEEAVSDDRVRVDGGSNPQRFEISTSEDEENDGDRSLFGSDNVGAITVDVRGDFGGFNKRLGNDYYSPMFVEISPNGSNSKVYLWGYSEDNDTVTFSGISNTEWTGSLKNTLGTDDFHVTVSFGSNKITFSTTDPKLPEQPTDLQVSFTTSHVNLEWTAGTSSFPVSDNWAWEFQYKKSVDTSWPASWIIATNAGRDATTHQVLRTSLSNLEGNVEYDFRLRAKNGAGNGYPSNAAKVTVPGPPAKPAGLATAVGNGQVTLTWNNPDDDTITGYEYRVDRNNDEDFEDQGEGWQPISNSDDSTVSHTVTGLTNGNVHGFQIRAKNDEGYSEASDTAKQTPEAPLGKPQNFTLTPGNRTVKLTWMDPLPVSGGTSVGHWEYQAITGTYQPNDLIEFPVWGSLWTRIASRDLTTTNGTMEFTHSGLGNNAPRQYRLRGVSAGGSPGETTESLPATPHEKPNAPANFSVTPGDGSVTLNWDKPGNVHNALVTKYEYQQTTDISDFGEWQIIPDSNKDTRDHTFSSLQNLTTYYFKIRAVTATYPDGDASNGKGATPNVAPAKPVLDDLEPGDARVKLTWTYTVNTSTVDNWQFRLRENGAPAWGGWTPIGGSSATTRDHTVMSGLTNGTTYDFQVRARTIGGVASPPSNFRSAKPAAPPAKPTGLVAEAGDRGVTLTWTDPENADIDRYQYEINGDGNWEDMKGSDATTAKYTVTGLTNGTAYTFKIRAVTVGGTADSDASASVTPDKIPLKPSGFRLEPGNAEIKLVWNDQSNDLASIVKWQYQEKVGDDPWPDENTWTDVVPSDKNTKELERTSLTNGTKYGYRIRAVATNDKFGPPSDDQFATPAGPPKAATELKAEAGARRVTLSWMLAADASIEKWQYQQSVRTGETTWSEWPKDEANADIWTDMQGSNASTRSYTVRDLTGDVEHRFHIRAIGYGGDGSVSNIATATPEPGLAAEEEKRVLKQTMAAVAQATLASAVDTIGHRFDAAPRANTLTLAGRTVGGVQDTPVAAMASEDEETVFGTDPWADARLSRDSMEPWNDAHLQAQRVDENSLLWDSGFTLSLSDNGSGAGGSGWTLWGRGDWGGFEGVDGTESWDGKQWTAWLGADTRMSERVMAGLAVSRGVVETDYTLDGEFEGTLETSLTTVWPYVQLTTGPGSSVRLVLGAGTGDAEHRGFDEEVEEASLSLFAGSVSGRFLMTRSGGASISAIAGASMSQIKTSGEAAASSIAGLKANSWRVRAGVEAAHDGYPLSSESDWTMAPRGSVSARQDGGDGVNGSGLEVAAGVRLSAPDGRISLDASGHWLAAHSKDGIREWGASVEARLRPQTDGRGLSLSFGTGWGHQHPADKLAREGLFDGDERQVDPQGLSFTARTGYGFEMSGGLLTPFAEVNYEGDEARTRSFETGISFARGEFDASMTAGLRDSDDSDPESRIGMELHLRH